MTAFVHCALVLVTRTGVSAHKVVGGSPANRTTNFFALVSHANPLETGNPVEVAKSVFSNESRFDKMKMPSAMSFLYTVRNHEHFIHVYLTCSNHRKIYKTGLWFTTSCMGFLVWVYVYMHKRHKSM